MEISSSVLKALALQYWRYDRGCPVVALECDGADVQVVTKGRRLIEIEVKVSLPDLNRDIAKVKHLLFREQMGLDVSEQHPEWQARRRGRIMFRAIESVPFPVYEFYFLLSPEIADTGLMLAAEKYPYAGVFTATIYGNGPGFRIGDLVLLKKAKCFRQAPRLSFRQLSGIVKAQSATLTRLALAGCRAAREGNGGH